MKQAIETAGETRQELIHLLIENIHRVIRGMTTGGGFPFGNVELSRPHVGILFCVAKHKEGVSVKDLAAALNVTSGAISQFVDRLIEKGLVVREEDPNDGRVFRIKLTRSARSRFEAFKATYFKSITPLFDELTDRDLKKFVGLLRKIDA
jgi:DNA-binding MarR family transcriptional regulator